MDFTYSVGCTESDGLDSHLHHCNVTNYAEELLTTNLNDNCLDNCLDYNFEKIVMSF